MDLNKYYKKLPKKIQNSEKFLYYGIEFYEFIRKFSKSKKTETNSYLNFLFKSTNIEVTGFLRDVQVLSVELLRFIDYVCNKYDLEYFLIYGSLLGAVRHKGFIPWDDDLDIMMMRNDYNKLIEVLPHEINKFDFLKKNCGLTKLKNFNDNLFENTNHIYTPIYEDYFFKDNGYKQRFLQFACLKPFVKIDIFPFDYIKEDFVEKYNKYYFSQKYLFMMLYAKNNFLFDEEFSNISQKLGITLNETPYIGEGIDCTCCDNFGAFKKEVIYPVKNITFEDYLFKCPNKPHELLKLWYGENYMELPPSIDMHDFSEYNLILFKNNEEDMGDAFKNAIYELKRINDNLNKL